MQAISLSQKMTAWVITQTYAAKNNAHRAIIF